MADEELNIEAVKQLATRVHAVELLLSCLLYANPAFTRGLGVGLQKRPIQGDNIIPLFEDERGKALPQEVRDRALFLVENVLTSIPKG